MRQSDKKHIRSSGRLPPFKCEKDSQQGPLSKPSKPADYEAQIYDLLDMMNYLTGCVVCYGSIRCLTTAPKILLEENYLTLSTFMGVTVP
ncbi:hypothetical protein DAPPUDRAFT_239295 [Daphnia pulex]|uniref:Uncharacterized protein n=1 Tax=Daphnia pulex TaxID=6669 RepID=E9G8X0_DAPPU|nr:hypothetical protein DAPPUDRAFT_239295 [Daphnia pulex]|eukprot:EFX84048.1 hypothetical protein DAPPUDRAFT_239295 [Daphnia pulex]